MILAAGPQVAWIDADTCTVTAGADSDRAVVSARVRSSGPTQGTFTDDDQWQSRPWMATALTVLSRLAPVTVAAFTGTVVARRVLPTPHGLGVLAWVVAVLAVSQLTVQVVEVATRRLVPLSTMLRFSLVFPDRAPSRFAVALRTGSVEKMRRESAEAMANGLPESPSEALATALVMITSLSDHDRRTRGHSDRVRAFSELIAAEMGLSREFRERLRWGAVLHDMGKLTVSAAILNKPGRPTADEWTELQTHPMNGELMLAPLADWLGDAVHAAGQHHERWDGGGYPQGLKGEEISLSARIVAVADAYDVMTAARSYKKALPAQLARVELTKNAGTQFDPVVVRALLKVSVGKVTAVAAGPLGALVNLPYLGSILTSASAVPSAAVSGATALAMTGLVMSAPSALPWREGGTRRGPSLLALASSSDDRLPELGFGEDADFVLSQAVEGSFVSTSRPTVVEFESSTDVARFTAVVPMRHVTTTSAVTSRTAERAIDGTGVATVGVPDRPWPSAPVPAGSTTTAAPWTVPATLPVTVPATTSPAAVIAPVIAPPATTIAVTTTMAPPPPTTAPVSPGEPGTTTSTSTTSPSTTVASPPPNTVPVTTVVSGGNSGPGGSGPGGSGPGGGNSGSGGGKGGGSGRGHSGR